MNVGKYVYIYTHQQTAKESTVMNNTLIATSQALTVEGCSALIEPYVASLDAAPRSKDTYRKAVKRFFEWYAEQGIEAPTREDILAYKADLMSKYKACTVSSYMSAVKSFFAFLEATGRYPNIAAGIKGAKATRGFRKDALSAAQAVRVISGIDRSTLEGLRDYALVNLLIRTGLRTIEAERADIGDIRAETGESLLYIQGKGRDSKDAFVVLTEATAQPIREYLRARGKQADSAPLFASCSDRNNGERLTTRSISRIVKEALKRVGLDSDRLTAHSLRHTAVTLSLLAGATIQEAQQLARHSSVNTTMIYAHNIDRIARAPERRIDELLENTSA